MSVESCLNLQMVFLLLCSQSSLTWVNFSSQSHVYASIRSPRSDCQSCPGKELYHCAKKEYRCLFGYQSSIFQSFSVPKWRLQSAFGPKLDSCPPTRAFWSFLSSCCVIFQVKSIAMSDWWLLLGLESYLSLQIFSCDARIEAFVLD